MLYVGDHWYLSLIVSEYNCCLLSGFSVPGVRGAGTIEAPQFPSLGAQKPEAWASVTIPLMRPRPLGRLNALGLEKEAPGSKGTDLHQRGRGAPWALALSLFPSSHAGLHRPQKELSQRRHTRCMPSAAPVIVEFLCPWGEVISRSYYASILTQLPLLFECVYRYKLPSSYCFSNIPKFFVCILFVFINLKVFLISLLISYILYFV